MKIKFLVCCIALFAIAFGCKEAPQAEVIVVSAQEMQELIALEQIQVVDVRSAEEFKTGYIPNSQNIDYTSPTFEQDLGKLDKTKPVIVYCKSGGRSARCSQKLIEAGFEKVYDLDGGIAKWKFSGNEIQTIE